MGRASDWHKCLGLLSSVLRCPLTALQSYVLPSSSKDIMGCIRYPGLSLNMDIILHVRRSKDIAGYTPGCPLKHTMSQVH